MRGSPRSPRSCICKRVLDRLPGQISEGEKQRVAVARAVVRDPNCFLFDEPLSRLDVELRQSMRGQIKSVLADLSKATVIVTHDQLEALTMADRIAIMRDGVDRAGRNPARGVRQAGQRVCRELHRHAADEPDGGGVRRLRQGRRRKRSSSRAGTMSTSLSIPRLQASHQGG